MMEDRSVWQSRRVLKVTQKGLDYLDKAEPGEMDRKAHVLWLVEQGTVPESLLVDIVSKDNKASRGSVVGVVRELIKGRYLEESYETTGELFEGFGVN
ncbi:hypothetical protein LCGC14_3035220 [marine sediment metagenome]|uniref:Uncharacterized protein n=1 Tax=marine sediment metagenome TaxID=412755 RepID=A0A0F8XEK4_9ZZZZ